MLEKILAGYEARSEDMAKAISVEMGAPMKLARESQAPSGTMHLQAMIEVLDTFKFEEPQGKNKVAYEAVGVCALITPWNWPMNQVGAKVVPALAAGCTMVLKPSEFSPFSAMIWAEILHDAGVPAGVFNLINGEGAVVGAALSSHPDIDMVSFTGSTRAGKEVARNAAATVKRVHQELGGKSPNVLLDDVDFEKAVSSSICAPDGEFRPVVQCADAHAGARVEARRSGGDRQARRRIGRGGRSRRRTRPGSAPSSRRSSSIVCRAISRKASRRARNW